MQSLHEALADYRASRKTPLPYNDLIGVRVNKLHGTKIRAQAALLKCSPAELMRMFAAKGAEQYGIDLESVSLI